MSAGVASVHQVIERLGPDQEPAPARKAVSVRHARVAAGLAELERWLADQVRQGLAAAGERDWADLARRLVDAQAPGAAGIVSRLAQVRAEDDWPAGLLAEYSLLHLLAVAYRRRAELPEPLARTVLIRTGFPVTREEVLAGPAVRDRWHVLGRRDETHDRLTARRVWLRGHATGRAALILTFAPSGRQLDDSLVTGTAVDADLAFYPGAAPLRALVTTRDPAPRVTAGPGHDDTGDTAIGRSTTASYEPTAARADPAGRVDGSVQADATARVDPAARERPAAGEGAPGGAPGGAPPGVSPEEAMDEVARALADDPWIDSWPLVLADVVPTRTTLGGFPLHPRARDPWRLLAVSGGRPVTVAAEWTPRGLRPLTTWDDDTVVVV